MARKSRKIARQLPPVPDCLQHSLCKTGIYARLSVEDNGGDAGDSLQNQIEYLKEYVKRNGDDFQLEQVYLDNGATGTNFLREGWQKLLDDVKAGKIQCIIVKDFSRIGRNYIEVGNYLEKIFPFLGVRVVSVNDHFDSRKSSFESNMLMNSLTNIVNDYYAKDISRKVVQARRAMQENGEYTSGVYPYGYRKAHAGSRKMSVDAEAAVVVKKIFEWRVLGKSNAWIANSLNELAIPSPGLYRLMNGKQAYRQSANAKWNIAHISGILKNPVYLGRLVQGKSRRSYFRENGKKRRMPEEEWVITENAHEPLVTQEQFEIAARLAGQSLEKYRKQMSLHADVPHMENPLRGKIYCGQCGRRMSRRSRVKGGIRRYYYFCDSRRTKIDAHCLGTMIYEAVLMETVREVTVRYLQAAGDTVEMWNCCEKGRAENRSFRNGSKRIHCGDMEQKEKARQELLRLKRKMQELYEDMKEGLLTGEDFAFEREQLAQRQRQYEEELKELTGLGDDTGGNVNPGTGKAAGEGGQPAMEILAACCGAASEADWKEVPSGMLDSLIREIIVLPGGRIEIAYTYGDVIGKRGFSPEGTVENIG